MSIVNNIFWSKYDTKMIFGAMDRIWSTFYRWKVKSKSGLQFFILSCMLKMHSSRCANPMHKTNQITRGWTRNRFALTSSLRWTIVSISSIRRSTLNAASKDFSRSKSTRIFTTNLWKDKLRNEDSWKIQLFSEALLQEFYTTPGHCRLS